MNSRVDRHSQRSACCFLFALIAAISLSMWTGSATAQEFPRIGLSASPDSYVDQIKVEYNTEFLLYAMIFGPEEGVPLQESVSEIPWVIHQVCCGAVLAITDIEYNPLMEHTGNPLAGMKTTTTECVSEDRIWLATLTVRLDSQFPGDFIWAAGPIGSVLDCGGEGNFMSGMAVTVSMEDSPTPNDLSPWGQVKAMYR